MRSVWLECWNVGVNPRKNTPCSGETSSNPTWHLTISHYSDYVSIIFNDIHLWMTYKFMDIYIYNYIGWLFNNHHHQYEREPYKSIIHYSKGNDIDDGSDDYCWILLTDIHFKIILQLYSIGFIYGWLIDDGSG